jgi:signal transduction histidine kinase
MQRIGQDLHDDICQHLAGISMLSSVLKIRLKESDPEAAESMEQIEILLSESITRTKTIARGLYPTGLSERGLVIAIKELIDSAIRSFGIPIDYFVAPGFKLHDKAKVLQIYRIIQEALTNAFKHAKSDRIKVSLYYEQDTLSHREAPCYVIEVVDNGTGLPDALAGRGMGLRIMRYRAETIGADLIIDRLEPGTRIQCRIREQEA